MSTLLHTLHTPLGLRSGREDGFTIVELLVVVLVIGVLAAIAVPLFLRNGNKGNDATAQTNARNLLEQLEGCVAERTSRDYAQCDTMTELGDPDGIPWGTAAGEVSVTAAGASTFTITAVSKSTDGSVNHKFLIARNAAGSIVRTCTTPGGNTAGQCKSGAW